MIEEFTQDGTNTKATAEPGSLPGCFCPHYYVLMMVSMCLADFNFLTASAIMFQLKYQMNVFRALHRCNSVGVYFKLLYSKICTKTHRMLRHFTWLSFLGANPLMASDKQGKVHPPAARTRPQ